MEQLSKSKIKLIQSLRLKKSRDREEKFIVEGKKSILDFMSEDQSLLEFISTTSVPLNDSIHYSTDEVTYKKISSLKNGDGYLAVFNKPKQKVVESDVFLVLDGIQDPGNLGTIIRTADWFGVKNIYCSIDTVDQFNEKVVQSTMGSLLRVQVQYVDIFDLFSSNNLPIYGALLEGDNIYNTTIKKPCFLIIGNEGQGIRNENLKFITNPINIPGKGGAESLNAAIATGILLSEFNR